MPVAPDCPVEKSDGRKDKRRAFVNRSGDTSKTFHSTDATVAVLMSGISY